MPAELAERARRRCPACAPSRRAPSRPTRRKTPETRSGSGSHICSRATPLRRARGRRPRPAAGCRARGVPSAARPAGSRARWSGRRRRLLAGGQFGRRRRRRSRRRSAPLQRDQHAVARGRRAATAARQAAAAAGRPSRRGPPAGSTRPVGRPPGDHLHPGDLRGVLGAGRSDGHVGGPGRPGNGRRGSPGQRKRALRGADVVPRRQDRRVTSSVERLPAGLARRIALAAQGFADPRPTGAGRHPAAAARRPSGWRVVQIDSVNVLSRSHYMPAFSRLGPYPRAALDDAVRPPARRCSSTGRTRRPSCRCGCSRTCAGAWRRPRSTPGGTWCGCSGSGPVRRRGARPGAARAARSGPATCRAPARPAGHHVELARRQGRAGVAVLHRRAHRPRPDRRLRAGLRPHRAGAARRRCCRRRRRSAADAVRELVRTAARALGVATERDLRDYFRLPRGDARTAIAELAEARGAAAGARSTGWGAPGLAGPGGAASAVDPGAGAAEPVRLPGLGAAAGRADLRLPLPAGDLHAGRQAGARLLRAAVPARRPAGGPRRPQGRPAGRRAAGAGGARRGGRRPRRGGRGAGRRAAAHGRLAGARRGGGRPAPATSRPISRAAARRCVG